MTTQVFLTTIFILPRLVIASLPVTPASLTTTLGSVTGVRKAAGGNRLVEVFYGIPFAKPPVNELRFRPPVPADPWEGTLDGTQAPQSCWQTIDTSFKQFPGVEMWNPNTPRSEDCLYLNVWRPAPTCTNSETQPKSILVWIYGGGFYSGTTTLDLYDGTQLSVLNDVIVVSIAYRLGPLGFLYAGNSEAPGNAGLMDQVLGLKWVKENAAHLGGSPDDITIFGESAGAVSVGLHLLAPVSRDLFNYAILQSGAPLADWAIQSVDVAKNISLKLASAVSCQKQNISASINCLRTIDPHILVEKQFEVEPHVSFPFTPVIDGHFIPDHPRKMMERGDFKNTSILLGVNKNEGVYFNIYDFKDDLPISGDGKISECQFDKMVSKYCNNDQHSCDIIKAGYTRNSNTSFTELLDDISGDTYFKCPVASFAELFKAHGGSVFMYNFAHRVSTNPWPVWTGVVHGYEIELLFGLPLAPGSVYTEEEKTLSLRMMKFWTRFAKTGNPNFANEWPEYTTSSKDYITIDNNDVLKVGHGLRISQCAVLANAAEPFQQTDTPTVRIPEIEASSLTLDNASIRGHVLHAFGQ